jgi:hypothetical protein
MAKGKKDKQWSLRRKLNIATQIAQKMGKVEGWTQFLQKCEQFLLHDWHKSR